MERLGVGLTADREQAEVMDADREDLVVALEKLEEREQGLYDVRRHALRGHDRLQHRHELVLPNHQPHPRA